MFGLIRFRGVPNGWLNIDSISNAGFSKQTVAAAYFFFESQCFKQRAQRTKIQRLVMLSRKQSRQKLLPPAHIASPSSVLAELLCTSTFT